MKKIIWLNLFVLLITLNTYAQNNSDFKGISGDKTNNAATDGSLITKNNFRSKSPVIIHKIPSPILYINDIAFDGVDLWIEGYGAMQLYKISTADGTIKKSIPTNIVRAYGLEFINGKLWVTDGDNHIIQQVDTSNGTVLSTIPTPGNSATSYPGGLAWDGQHLWNNDQMGPNFNPHDSTYKIDINGIRLNSYHAFGTGVTGLAWDGQYLWSSDNGSLEIYKIDVSTFTIVDTIDAPGGFYPNGVAFDGHYLWVSNSDADSIYQLDIGFVGIQQYAVTDHTNVSVYPNPAKDNLFIEIKSSYNEGSVLICNISGQEKIRQQIKNGRTQIDISSLAKGVYFMKLFTGNTSEVIKIVKE